MKQMGFEMYARIIPTLYTKEPEDLTLNLKRKLENLAKTSR